VSKERNGMGGEIEQRHGRYRASRCESGEEIESRQREQAMAGVVNIPLFS
jgi:hypothetical protein